MVFSSDGLHQTHGRPHRRAGVIDPPEVHHGLEGVQHNHGVAITVGVPALQLGAQPVDAGDIEAPGLLTGLLVCTPKGEVVVPVGPPRHLEHPGVVLDHRVGTLTTIRTDPQRGTAIGWSRSLGHVEKGRMS